ncbi:hypothetical protein AGR1B_pAt30147 [Agrobacterium fabacearum S56]|nr:hypothetical protein AGR1B_pAt30147 [Agrobacterium fabacearum S56]
MAMICIIFVYRIPKLGTRPILDAENSKFNLRNYADFIVLYLCTALQSVMLAGAMR